MSILTNVKDLDLLIMEKMDDKTLLSFCQSSKGTNELCQNEHFWKRRFFNKFGNYLDFEKYKDDTRSWKSAYLSMLKYEVDPENYKINTFARALIKIKEEDIDLSEYLKRGAVYFIRKVIIDQLEMAATIGRRGGKLIPYTWKDFNNFLSNNKKEVIYSALKVYSSNSPNDLVDVSFDKYMKHSWVLLGKIYEPL